MNTEATDLVYLTNSKPRILHLPDRMRRTQGQNGDVQVVCMNDGKSIMPSAPREKDGQIMPTAIDRAYWDRVKTNAQVKTWMRLGWLSVSDTSGTDDEVDDLTKYNAATAVTLVSGEDNLRLLTEWAKSETRADVKAAISGRLESVKAGKNKLPPIKAQ